MKYISIFLVGYFFLSNTLQAQLDFRSAFIIDNIGDTLFGEINYQDESLMSRQCQFRKNKEAEKRQYFPSDIRGFRFDDSKYFVSKEIDGEQVFLEFLIDGEVDIYYFNDNTKHRYFLDKTDISLTEIPYTEKIIERDGKSFQYESKSHQGLLSYHLEDAPKLKSKISNMVKPDHKNLIQLGKAYHEQVCEDGTDCIVYEKKHNSLKLSVELVSRFAQYKNSDLIPQIGAFVHIRPSRSEKLYIKTGVNIFSIKDDNVRLATYFMIPLQIGYIYPNGRVRPRVSIGTNIWLQQSDFLVGRPINFTSTLEGGCNIQLTNKLFISVTADVEYFTKVLFVPNDLLAYSGRLGLFFNL